MESEWAPEPRIMDSPSSNNTLPSGDDYDFSHDHDVSSDIDPKLVANVEGTAMPSSPHLQNTTSPGQGKVEDSKNQRRSRKMESNMTPFHQMRQTNSKDGWACKATGYFSTRRDYDDVFYDLIETGFTSHKYNSNCWKYTYEKEEFKGCHYDEPNWRDLDHFGILTDGADNHVFYFADNDDPDHVRWEVFDCCYNILFTQSIPHKTLEYNDCYDGELIIAIKDIWNLGHHSYDNDTVEGLVWFYEIPGEQIKGSEVGHYGWRYANGTINLRRIHANGKFDLTGKFDCLGASGILSTALYENGFDFLATKDSVEVSTNWDTYASTTGFAKEYCPRRMNELKTEGATDGNYESPSPTKVNSSDL